MITFPNTSKLIEELLYGLEKRPLDREIADIIFAQFQNKSQYFIEYEAWDDPRLDKPEMILLERPNLWRFDSYLSSSEKWKTIRNYSEQQRIKDWIEKANIKMVSFHLQRILLMEEPIAQMTAYKLVKQKKWKQIRAVGIDKQITKEEEL